METTQKISIPMENWGKDHWSLLAFFETQVVKNINLIDTRRMRINDKKRQFGNGNGFSWQDSWGTRQKDGNIPDGSHDDIDVMEELQKEGFCKNEFTNLNPLVTLTKKGWETCAKIREHKGNGGVFNNFKI